jgi:hypothetical protein
MGGWNFLSGPAHDYARRHSSGFRVFNDRLWRNMLSSQPLAFNIAGELRADRDAAAAVFADLTGLPVESVGALGEPSSDPYALDGIDAEWAPPSQCHTGDGSGFDIAALLRLDDRRRVLVTIEVKYTDSFSPGFKGDTLRRKTTQHEPHLAALGIPTEVGTALLRDRETSQFLRSVMITESAVRRGLRGDEQLDGGLAVVLALDADQNARRGVQFWRARSVRVTSRRPSGPWKTWSGHAPADLASVAGPRNSSSGT